MRSSILATIGLLVIISVVWVGVTLFDTLSTVDTSPNAEQYLRPIEPVFNEEALSDLDTRTKALPVSPKVLLDLEKTLPTPSEE